MKLPQISNVIKIRLIGLFVALSLSVTYYYLVAPWALGIPGNSTNLWVFSAMSKPSYHPEVLGVWRPRVAGLWIAGRMMDGIVKEGYINAEDYQQQKIVLLRAPTQDNQGAYGQYMEVEDYRRVFALYQACWMFLFFGMLVFLLKEPVFTILGIFAGMLYIFTPLAAHYFYPWDLPSVTAFTLSILLWQRKRYNLMLAVIFFGYAFKETVAVTALLYFFTEMPIRKRVLYFVAAAVSTTVLKLAIMKGLYGVWKLGTQDVVLSDGNILFFVNIGRLFAPTWNSVWFVNAGTLLVALLLPARNRTDWGIKIVLLAFCGGQMVSGGITEFRIWLEVLPISLILLRDYLKTLSPIGPELGNKATSSAKPQALK
ncbi:MAG TPA: hypothetical protein PKA41_04690 [Verrucomicrobiota bacterium]|nr:hypothetical protein [Verrucomicrobiota bacterium]